VDLDTLPLPIRRGQQSGINLRLNKENMTDIKDLIIALRSQSNTYEKLLEKKMKMEQELGRLQDETIDCRRALTVLQQTLESRFPDPDEK